MPDDDNKSICQIKQFDKCPSLVPDMDADEFERDLDVLRDVLNS